MRSSTAPGASLLTSLAVSDLSPMSTSIPSSSGEEELGELGVAMVGVRNAVAESLILKSIGESETVGGDTGLSSVSGRGEEVGSEARAERAAPNLARSSLCSERSSRWERNTGAW